MSNALSMQDRSKQAEQAFHDTSPARHLRQNLTISSLSYRLGQQFQEHSLVERRGPPRRASQIKLSLFSFLIRPAVRLVARPLSNNLYC